jgi:serine/threonine-protein kinase HipA
MTEPPAKDLAVLLHGYRAGTLTEGEAGRYTLTYDPQWRNSPIGHPISLSMPLSVDIHHDDIVRPFLWGLLPDSERVLERWGRTYQVSARNPFALLRHVGEDCAGAAQFATPDREAALLAGDGGINRIDQAEIAQRLRILRRDPAAWHAAETGQFSLAGAQAKTALHHDPVDGTWGDPWGAQPTTHIMKPAVSGFDDHDLNEHLCLEAARQLGLSAARSWVARFDSERVIVVERYDRVPGGDGFAARIHQEDLCQALGVMPTSKYQNEGGPGAEQILRLLRSATSTEEAARQFVDALAFNWLIAGTDAHAKNYSVLITSRDVRLAPLYDVSSALPYDDMYLPRLKMAMRIGGEYLLERINGRHWRRFAAGNLLDADALLARIGELADRLPEAMACAADNPAVRALDSPLPARLVERVTTRAARCRDALR